MVRRGVLPFGALVVAVAVATFLFLHASSDGGPGSMLMGNDQGATHEYVIAPGTIDRIARGEDIDVLPAEIAFRVGDSIRIRNEDTKGSVVGPFYVDAKSVMTQRFTSAGSYTGLCSVHPSGKLTLTVRK
jgi:plastocyanin